MRVLVTGGAGYIGSHTTKALVRAGHEPVVFDNFVTGHRWAAKWGKVVEGDLANSELVAQVIRENDVKAVIHFAASLMVGESMTLPQKYFWNNVVNTLRLLDCMVAEGVKHIVFSSSAAVYGTPHVVPIPEDHPRRPINPYGETKDMMERALHWYGAAYGIRSVPLRYFNAAGADPDGEIGEDHQPESHLIPLVIEATLGHRPVVEVYGTDYATPDGTAVRDYIHVTDLADAHVLALRYLIDGGESAAMNLGTGNGYSVREVIAAVGKLSGGRTVPFRDTPRRAGDPATLVANPEKAREVLGWRPNFSDLETIVQTAWKWHVKRSQSGH